MRTLTLLVVSFSLAVSACTVQEREEWRNGPTPECETTSRGRLLLMAQSVPDATLIPCIGELPPGWELSRARARTSRSVLMFANDTLDLDANVVLAPSCDVSDARHTESPRARTLFFVSNDGRTMTFTFDGGCIRFEYETRELAESAEGRRLIEGVEFMTRDRLRALSAWSL